MTLAVVREPALTQPSSVADETAPQLLVLSAASDQALEAATRQLQEVLRLGEGIPLRDIAYGLHTSDLERAHRRMLVCVDRADAIVALNSRDPKRLLSTRTDGEPTPIVLLLPGVGDQYVGMAHDLYLANDTFRQQVDQIALLFEQHLGTDIRTVLYPPHLRWKTDSQSKGIDLKRMLGRSGGDPDTATLNRTLFAQPALFTIEYAMAQLWRSVGIEPSAILGHSMGEFVAACLANVISLQDVVRLVAVRAKLAEDLPQTGMLSVMLSEEALAPLLDRKLHVCLVNGPQLCVVAGTIEAVTELEQRLVEREVIGRRIQNAHAFHSPLMRPIAAAYEAEVRQIRLHEPSIPYISNVTGDWITAEQATDPAHWVRHLTQTARFHDAFQQLWQLPDATLLECGPGRTLTALASQHPQSRDPYARRAICSLRHSYESVDDRRMLLTAVGKLWLTGSAIRWEGVSSPSKSPGLRVIATDGADGPATLVAEATQGASSDPACPESDGYTAPRNDLERSLTRACERLLGVSRVGINDNLFELGAHSLTIIRLVVEIKQSTGLDLDVGEAFRSPSVAALVEHLGKDAKRNASIVIPLQPKGDGTPIFCLCGIDIYKRFALGVGEDQPVYGVYVDEERAIIDQALHGKAAGVSIERLVEAYYDAIVRFWPQGPYRLAGVSFGGLLATALACKMRAQGAMVDVVFLFDTVLPEARQRIWWRWVIKQLAAVAVSGGGKKIARLKGKARRLLRGGAEPSASKDAANSSVSKVSVEDKAAFFRQVVQLQRSAFVSAYGQWNRDRSIIDFRIVLFRAAIREWAASYEAIAEDYGWRRYAGEHLSIVDVPGSHLTLLEAPHVDEVAREAQRCLGMAAAPGLISPGRSA